MNSYPISVIPKDFVLENIANKEDFRNLQKNWSFKNKMPTQNQMSLSIKPSLKFFTNFRNNIKNSESRDIQNIFNYSKTLNKNNKFGFSINKNMVNFHKSMFKSN